MRKVSIWFLVCISVSSGAQKDTLFFWQKNNILNSSYEIVIPGKQSTLLEKYVFFKERYWFISRDTFPESYSPGMSLDGKTPKVYEKKFKCDSLVNSIRNEASYYKTKHALEDQGGYYERGCFPDRDWKFFRRTCHEDYLKWENEKKQRACQCIDSADSFHLKRMERILADTSLLTEEFIRSFLREGFASPYPSCYDAVIMAQIIKRKTAVFITFITAMDEMDFFTFLFKLEDFPGSVNTNELKLILKDHPVKSHRKKRAIKRIENVKDNRWCKGL